TGPSERPRSWRSSWVEQPLGPIAVIQREQAPLVEAVGAIAPELDPLRDHAIAAPMWRARHVLAFEAGLGVLEALLESCAAIKRARLVRRPGAKLRIPRPAREIGIGLRVGHALHRTLDTDLAPERLPVKQQGGARISLELAALGALLVGVECEAAGSMALEEHHSRRRPPGAVGGCESHCFGVVGLACARLGEPLI